MADWVQKLRQFLHDPIDKCFSIPNHIQRAKKYAESIGVSNIDEVKGSDWIASCMERNLLPKGIIQGFNEIRHPFSEEKICIEEIGDVVVFNFVKDAFCNIGEEIKYRSDKEKFLYLWRNAIEIVTEKLEKSYFKKYIHVLPADTRIPNHSIWEHLKVTSAINASENYQNNSLFLFTIGPVQSFISQARKAQDLFMGSFLLSYLTFISMEEIIERYGPTNIIYPDLFSQPLMDFYLETVKNISVRNSYSNYFHQPTIPNKFVAILPEGAEDRIRDLAESLTKKVKREWGEIVTTVMKSFNIRLNNVYLEKQVGDFPEIYWVAIPFRRGEKDVKVVDLEGFLGDTKEWQDLWDFAERNGEYQPNIGLLYQALYISLEKSMGARKNLRVFDQTEEEGKKCYLCGEREGVVKEGIGDLKVGKFINNTEDLCVLCFVKRGLEKYLETKFSNTSRDFSFPSTAEVALANFKKRALVSVRSKFEEYIGKFKEIIGEDNFREIKVNPLPRLKDEFGLIENLDGEWFFEENLQMLGKQFKKNIRDEEIGELKWKLKKITEEVGEPNPYYAVIMLDADNVGRWLQGELLPKIEFAYNSDVWCKLPQSFRSFFAINYKKVILTPAIHAAISTALRNYSIEFARKIVEEEHYGKLIYAGGDDLLAFVNLKDLFSVIRKLRAAFSGNINLENDEVKVDWNNTSGFVEKEGKLVLTMGKNATASCGAVVAHYKTPLKIVVSKVREIEKMAKEGEKDAFGIGLLKHSGEERLGLSKWKYGEVDVLLKLIDLGRYLGKGNGEVWISKRFIYNLDEEFERLKDKEGYFISKGKLFEVELKRLLERATHSNNKEEKRKTIVDETFEFLRDIFWQTGGNVNNLIHILEITAFVTKSEERYVY